MSQTLFVTVLLDKSFGKPLDYSVPDEWQGRIQVGARVEVPLRTGTKKGTIAALSQKAAFANVRPILRVLDQKEIAPSLWKLAEWMSSYYASPLDRVLKCFTPPNVRREVTEKTQVFLRLKKTLDETASFCEKLRGKSPPQAAVLDLLLKATKGLFLADIVKETGLSRSPIDSLVKKGILEAKEVTKEENLLAEEEFFPTKPKRLNSEQEGCLEEIVKSLQKDEFKTHLLFGITGSGKTEVYLQAIAEALRLGKSAILLVPEISLTSQTIEGIRARFQEKIAVLHHKKSLGERNTSWEGLLKGEIRIVIGARSAIFAPTQNLGLIIIDEEHDSSYKQGDESPSYNGRDVAVMRGFLEKATVILGSATPSMESRYNAEVGKYQLHTLSARATHSKLPKVTIVDMQTAFERSGGFTHFSPELLDAMKERFQKGEQTLLFLNKRGFHRMQLCTECKTVIKCPHCDISLTFHKEANTLRCHLCNFSQDIHRACPSCGSTTPLSFKGFGTEHVERSLHAIFPEVRTLRMDRDTTEKKNSHEELFRQFRSFKADVLIGTQMVAKGFHFPAVTLVGVLNLDASLSIPDFRASETTFQLLTQVAGRAGRSDLPGEVIFQTFLPDHPVIKLAAKQDYPTFFKETLEERKMFQYPPFSHLVKVTFSDREEKMAKEAAERCLEEMGKKVAETVTLFPVVPAGHLKVKDLFRYQFLIKTAKMGMVAPLLRELAGQKQVKVDIDPLSTFF